MSSVVGLEHNPSCLHCGLPVPADRTNFCCRGCETVYGILKANGLGDYYKLRERCGIDANAVPAFESQNSWSFLDDPSAVALYSGSDTRRMRFYVEGVHCVACVWLLEKIPQLIEGVHSVRLSLATSIADIELTSEGSFAEAAREIEKLGYRPHPIKSGETNEFRKLEDRKSLIRIGVAAACTMNSMLLAFSLYGGADGAPKALFRWVSFGLFVPVFSYSAIPFYRSAWSALRTRTISIDVPIVLGLIVGAAASLRNLVTGGEHLYFDSLSALVFLLLSSRHVLRMAQRKALDAANAMQFLAPSTAFRWDEVRGDYIETQVDSLNVGDIVRVRANETIPVDGVILEGVSAVDCALLTGESEPISVTRGSGVFAGTLNQLAPIRISVSSSGAQTRVGSILKSMEEHASKKGHLVETADKAAKWFVAGVVVLAAVGFALAWPFGFDAALNRALAIVIITCPCALALATPLTMWAAIARAARAGILIKNADALERLTQTKEVWLDKTGTLTEGRLETLRWIAADTSIPQDRIASVIVALERDSIHPIGRALTSYFRPLQFKGEMPVLTEYLEIAGRGVSAMINDSKWEIRALEKNEDATATESKAPVTRVGLYRDGKLVGIAKLGDRIRPDAEVSVTRLRELGLTPGILSGDAETPVQLVAGAVGIEAARAKSRIFPEEKNRIASASGHAIMVGDGANDAIALASAEVGIAVHGGMEISLRAADIWFSKPGVSAIADLVTLAREAKRVLYRNFTFSILYNLAGAAAALTGKVNPLFAAVLMPVSALTVYGSALLGTRKMRTLFRRSA